MLERRGTNVSLAVSLGLLALVATFAILLSASHASPSLAEGGSGQLDSGAKLVCPTLVDLTWNPSIYLTDTFFGEVCDVTWGTYYIRRGPDPYDSDTQHYIASLAAWQSFFRDKNVEEGIPYWYDTVQEYACPSGKKYLASRTFGGAPVTPGPSCEGDLIQDLSLSGIVLFEPKIRVWDGATLNLTGVSVEGGWIKSEGHDDVYEPPGGLLQLNNVTLLDHACVQFNAQGDNRLVDSTIEGDRYENEVLIGYEAEVWIQATKLYSGSIFITGEPRVTIAGSDFYHGAVTVQSGSELPIVGGIQIVGNRFHDASQGVVIWQYGGDTHVMNNVFTGTETSRTRDVMHVVQSLGSERLPGATDFLDNRISGYNAALTLGEGVTATIEGNLIKDCNTGLFLRYDSHAVLWNNTITGCGKGLTAWDEPTSQLRQNCIAENMTGIDISPFADDHLDIDARENWWGHPAGPLHSSNPDVQGNYVGSRASITDWLRIDNCFVDVASAVIGAAGGTVGTRSGSTSVSLPVGAVSQDTRVSVRPMSTRAMNTMSAPPDDLTAVRLFQVAGRDDASGNTVTHLDETAAVTTRLSEAEATGVDATTLTMARFEPPSLSAGSEASSGSTPQWALLPTEVDAAKVVLTATTEAFGTFAVLGALKTTSAYLPFVLR